MDEFTIFVTLAFDPELEADERAVLFRAIAYLLLEYLAKRFVRFEEPMFVWVCVLHFLTFDLRGLVVFQFFYHSFPIVFVF